MNDTSTQQDTSYNDILGNIGTQLKERQGLIAKRVAFVSLPLILTAVPLIYFGELAKDVNISSELKGIVFFVLLSLVLFVALPWAVISGQIFKVEQIIWIDSFFDKVPLDSKASWKIAKKLFWPSVWLNIIVFLRYYVPAIVLSICSLVLYIVLIAEKVILFGWLTFLALLIGILVAFAIYVYFISIHLRYLMFVLVDSYKTKLFSYRTLFSEMCQLNHATKTSDFTKMLVTLLGIEAAENATKVVLGILNGAVTSKMSNAGKVAGQSASMYYNEVVAANKKYAQAISVYILYKTARQLVHGTTQNINHELYSIATPDEKITKGELYE